MNPMNKASKTHNTPTARKANVRWWMLNFIKGAGYYLDAITASLCCG